MHPIEVKRHLEVFGFWFTYWQLRERNLSRTTALWLVWVARNIK